MEVTITKLNHEGKGITKIDNKITFIPNILTKEVADIEITKKYKKFKEQKVLTTIFIYCNRYNRYDNSKEESRPFINNFYGNSYYFLNVFHNRKS